MNEIEYFFADTEFGMLFCALRNHAVIRISFADDCEAIFPEIINAFPTCRLTEMAKPRWFDMRNLIRCFNAVNLPPISIEATPFQEKVWRMVAEIPAGATATYGDIARRIGMPRAARAVGTALAANKIALVIPCHRIVPADGSPGAYKWGMKRKKALLEYEKSFVGSIYGKPFGDKEYSGK